jgi:hypothetical protein
VPAHWAVFPNIGDFRVLHGGVMKSVPSRAKRGNDRRSPLRRFMGSAKHWVGHRDEPEGGQDEPVGAGGGGDAGCRAVVFRCHTPAQTTK